ncbi:MAG: hypothetical protein WCF90_01875 [Methanomicrobiales archaeon]
MLDARKDCLPLGEQDHYAPGTIRQDTAGTQFFSRIKRTERFIDDEEIVRVGQHARELEPLEFAPAKAEGICLTFTRESG